MTALIPTPVIESLIDAAECSKTSGLALAELNKIRVVVLHLATHFDAVRAQTRASEEGLAAVINAAENNQRLLE